MATTLLPRAKIGAKKKTISADSLRPNQKEKPTGVEGTNRSSTIEKLLSVKDWILANYKHGVTSFIRKRKERKEEKRRLREEEIEKKKKKKVSVGIFKTPTPIKNIFDSIGNFLLFLAGGVLFNKLFDLESGLNIIQKSLGAIGTGVQIFANLVGGFTNFIDSAVKGYDDFLQKIEDVSGFDKGKIEKFMEDFKFVINGAIIAAILTLRALPVFIRRWMRNRNTRLPGNIGNTRFNMINNRRTISGGRPLKPGPLSGIREWVRNRFHRGPTMTGDASLSDSLRRTQIIEGRTPGSTPMTGDASLSDTLRRTQIIEGRTPGPLRRLGRTLNPFNKIKNLKPLQNLWSGPTGASSSKKVAHHYLKGTHGRRMGSIKGKVGGWLTPLLAALTFKHRKVDLNQRTSDALIGTAAETGCATALGAKGAAWGAGIGGTLGAGAWGVGAVPGAWIGGILGGMVTGTLGAMMCGGVADFFTGAKGVKGSQSRTPSPEGLGKDIAYNAPLRSEPYGAYAGPLPDLEKGSENAEKTARGSQKDYWSSQRSESWTWIGDRHARSPVASIASYASYNENMEYINNIIQPIEV